MRTNSLISPEEAAGYALVISEEMAADQDAQCEAVEASLRWKSGPQTQLPAPLDLRDSHKTAWIPSGSLNIGAEAGPPLEASRCDGA